MSFRDCYSYIGLSPSKINTRLPFMQQEHHIIMFVVNFTIVLAVFVIFCLLSSTVQVEESS